MQHDQPLEQIGSQEQVPLANTQSDNRDNIRASLRKSALIRKRKEAILTWTNLSMEVTVKEKAGFLRYDKKQKQILENLNGYAKSGECLAIIGGSGAGKSSFMNLLADRVELNKDVKVSGEVKVNGQKMSYEKYKNVIGFVMQADIFLEHLTVREYFKFAIDLRSTGKTWEQRQDLLENAISMMKLEKAQNNYVGGVFRKGISGGEKKRLNIGFELLGDPSIVFLDEPTSGLDSYTSFMIITLLRQIAVDNNIVVVYTIHQPSIEIYNLFDNLMILDKGRNIYFGKAKDAIDYYAQMDYPVPPSTNPTNHFITIALRGPERNQAFYDKYNEFILPTILPVVQTQDSYEPFDVVNTFVGSFAQYSILLVRAFKNFVRNPMAFVIRLVQIAFLVVVFCMLYFRMSDDFNNPINVINREGALFFLSINLFISYFQNYLLTCELTSPRGTRVLLQGVQLRTVRRPAVPDVEAEHRAALHLHLRGGLRGHHLLYRRLQPERRPLLQPQ